jgi:hypothetical protein
VSPVRYGLGFYIPEDDILHRQRRENLKSYRDMKRLMNSSGSMTPRSVLNIVG